MADNNAPFADPPCKELCLWCIRKRGKFNSVNRTLKCCLPSIADKLQGLADNVHEAADDLSINFESHKPVKSKSHSITCLLGIARRRSITLHLLDLTCAEPTCNEIIPFQAAPELNKAHHRLTGQPLLDSLLSWALTRGGNPNCFIDVVNGSCGLPIALFESQHHSICTTHTQPNGLCLLELCTQRQLWHHALSMLSLFWPFLFPSRCSHQANQKWALRLSHAQITL